MTDIFSKQKRSWIMSRIRGKDTKIEKLLQSEMKKAGIKFKTHPKISGNPDFLVREKIVVFVDGCFWHGCPKHYRPPKSNGKFWLPKINKNMERDRKVTRQLRKTGYIVVRLWEHNLEDDIRFCIGRISKFE